ncbi:hypothetical protein NMY22_g5794 [Coprinellus aureogranulatus]|nr:hypothetical protein NMY22_g5794 [Coprinellus aureogranulatus]
MCQHLFTNKYIAHIDSRTALHAAVSDGQWDLVPLLVNEDTDLSSRPPNGSTALELAVRKKEWDTIDCLAEVTGQAPLEVLIVAESWKEARGLLEKGDIDVDIPFKDGKTALSVACHTAQWEIVRTLLRMGADIRRVTMQDRQPLLELFARAGDWESVLDLGVSNFDLNETFRDGCTALGVAIHAKEWDGLQVLLDAGADVNKQIKHDGYTDTPLRVACAEGAPVSVLELMLEKGAGPNVQGGPDNESCLHKACQERREDVVSLLLKYEANPDIQDPDKWTPLHYACSYGHAKCAHILLEAGANINAQSGGKWTALHVACYEGHVNCVKLLLEREADTSIKDKVSRTAFQDASRRGHTEVVELLRSYGLTE